MNQWNEQINRQTAQSISEKNYLEEAEIVGCKLLSLHKVHEPSNLVVLTTRIGLYSQLRDDVYPKSHTQKMQLDMDMVHSQFRIQY